MRPNIKYPMLIKSHFTIVLLQRSSKPKFIRNSFTKHRKLDKSPARVSIYLIFNGSQVLRFCSAYLIRKKWCFAGFCRITTLQDLCPLSLGGFQNSKHLIFLITFSMVKFPYYIPRLYKNVKSKCCINC